MLNCFWLSLVIWGSAFNLYLMSCWELEGGGLEFRIAPQHHSQTDSVRLISSSGLGQDTTSDWRFVLQLEIQSPHYIQLRSTNILSCKRGWYSHPCVLYNGEMNMNIEHIFLEIRNSSNKPGMEERKGCGGSYQNGVSLCLNSLWINVVIVKPPEHWRVSLSTQATN